MATIKQKKIRRNECFRQALAFAKFYSYSDTVRNGLVRSWAIRAHKSHPLGPIQINRLTGICGIESIKSMGIKKIMRKEKCQRKQAKTR